MKTILLVDDEVNIVYALTRLFRTCSFRIITATNGNEALQKIREEKPDIVILDIMMPELNGYEVCRLVREEEVENDCTSPLPIVMLTGQASEADRIIGKVIGATCYITKPCDFSELKKLVLSILDENDDISDSSVKEVNMPV